MKATTAGAERTRLSAAFTASADGRKSKIYIVLPRSTPLPEYTPPENVVVCYKTGGTFNDDILCDYLDQIMNNKAEGTTMILDSAKCHLTSKVEAKFTELKLNKEIIPPRFTNLLQPADVGWFASIKRKFIKIE